MKSSIIKTMKRVRRHNKIRTRVSGTSEIPRLAVFKSNAHMYAQLIDDVNATTLVSASDLKESTGTGMARAEAVGKNLAELAKKKGITQVVFDRGGFKYAGRIKTLADSARAHGLVF